jgi:hypothetical protein
VPYTFGLRVNFGILVKNYASTELITRYSPAKIINAGKGPQDGDPDFDRISTSHVERLNLQVRMCLQRFTTLADGHSNSLDHHTAMQAFFVDNFCRKHESLKGQAPAMAARLTIEPLSVQRLLRESD